MDGFYRGGYKRMSQKVPVQEPGNVTEPEFRYIVLAFVGIGIVGGLIFGLLRALRVPEPTAGGLWISYFISLPLVAKGLQFRTLRRTNIPAAVLIPHPSKFFIAPWRLILFGTLILLAVEQFSAALSGALLAMGGSTAAASLGIATLVGILAGGIAAYRVGKWVGARSRRRGFLIALSAIILAVFINVVATLTFLSQDPDLRSFMETSLGQPLRLNLTLLLQSLPPVVILIACAGAGVWRGSRKRSTMYLMYLLRLVGSDVREAISELAYEEVTKTAANAR